MRPKVAWLLLGCAAALVSCSPGQADDAQPCWYFAEGGEAAGDFAVHELCAILDESGVPKVAPEHLAAATFDDGLATFFIDRRWFYARSDGTLLEVLAYDNGADMWSSGLVRGPDQGKIMFFDRSLAPAMETAFDWAWPFEGDYALVCQGCAIEPADGDEHRALNGGVWGAIDLHGEPVVAIEHDRQEAMEELDGLRAQTVDAID